MLGLAKYGVENIAMGDVQETALQALADEVRRAYPAVDCLVLALDVTSEASVAAAVRATVARFGRVDMGLNIAGVAGPGGRGPAVDFADWKKTVDVNLHGVWLCQRAEIAQMLQQEYVRFPDSGGGGRRGCIRDDWCDIFDDDDCMET